MKKNILFGICLLTIFLSSQDPKPKTITGIWTLKYYINYNTGQILSKPTKDIFKDSKIEYTFRDNCKEGEIKGKTFVNDMYGKYELKYPNTIKVVEFGGTKVGDWEIFSNYQWSYMYKVTKYILDTDTLKLLYNDKNNDSCAMIFYKAK